LVVWWDRNWRLVISIILFPIWSVPMVSVLLFPETPLIRSVLYGLILSLFIAIGFRAARTAKRFGLRFLIAVVLSAVLTGLLIGVLSNLL
jgi:hypothetical protein